MQALPVRKAQRGNWLSLGLMYQVEPGEYAACITRYDGRISSYSLTYGFAIRPMIGFEYFLSHNFSFSTEVNVDLQFNEYLWFTIKDHYYGNRDFQLDVGTHRFGSFSLNYSF